MKNNISGTSNKKSGRGRNNKGKIEISTGYSLYHCVLLVTIEEENE
jgi:hypothetical protein